MSKGTRLFVAVTVAVVIGAAIGAAAGLLRNQGLVTVNGGVIGVLGGIIAGRVAAAVMRPKAASQSIKK